MCPPLTMCLVCPWFVRPDKRGTEHEARGALTPGHPGLPVERPPGPPPTPPTPSGAWDRRLSCPGSGPARAPQLPGSEGISQNHSPGPHAGHAADSAGRGGLAPVTGPAQHSCPHRWPLLGQHAQTPGGRLPSLTPGWGAGAASSRQESGQAPSQVTPAGPAAPRPRLHMHVA